MTYTYGTHGSPAVGGGLPGLPQRGDSGGKPQRSTYTRIVTPGSGVIEPPEGAKLMRVAVVGAGGGTPASNTGRSCGGGGGCSATNLVKAESIEYTVGANSVGADGGSSYAQFGAYSLIATGGRAGGTGAGVGVGGVGVGGDYNYSGGTGGGSGGGGAGGPAGEGGSDAANTPNVSDGWGVGGGGSGFSHSYGGGGSGANGGSSAIASVRLSSTFFGRTSTSAAGGQMGGGAGGSSSPGGVGGIVVEWFY